MAIELTEREFASLENLADQPYRIENFSPGGLDRIIEAGYVTVGPDDEYARITQAGYDALYAAKGQA